MNEIVNDVEFSYGKILERLQRTAKSKSQHECALKIMRLLTTAKRPLKAYEIQGFFSINPDDGVVDYENLSLRVDIKDLCGSLVEIFSSDTVDFVHNTVKG